MSVWALARLPVWGSTTTPAGGGDRAGFVDRADVASSRTVIDAPADGSDAEAVAAAFAKAVIDDDITAMAQLATSRYAAVLRRPAASGTRTSATVGSSAQALRVGGQWRGDVALLDVLLNTGPGPASSGSGRLHLVTVTVTRTAGGWRVDDARF